MAAAYGQQYAWEKKQGADKAKLDEIAAKVLREARAAIQADPNTRAVLHSLWKPQPGSIDDDLNELQDRPEFAELLEGKST